MSISPADLSVSKVADECPVFQGSLFDGEIESFCFMVVAPTDGPCNIFFIFYRPLKPTLKPVTCKLVFPTQRVFFFT